MAPPRVPLPTRPLTPTPGRFVRVNIGTLESPRFRPAIVTEVWPGEFGEKKPPGLNVTIFLSGLNDRAALEEHFLAEGNHRDNAANQALKLCSCLLWHQTSLPHGLGRRDWSWPRPEADVEVDVDALLALPVEQRATMFFENPFGFDWGRDKELGAYLQKQHEETVALEKAEREKAKAKLLAPEPVKEDAVERSTANFGLRDTGPADPVPETAKVDESRKADGPQEIDVAFDGQPEKSPEDLEEPASDAPAVSDGNGNPVIP